MKKERADRKTGQSVIYERSHDGKTDVTPFICFLVFKIMRSPQAERSISDNSKKCLNSDRASHHIIKQNT